MVQLFSSAFAEGTPATTAHATGSPMLVQMLMLVGFIAIFWLLIWRPQSKRTKAHKQLISNLGKGDEVITSGGILGRVTKVSDDYITLKVSDTTELNFQRSSIVAALPKGTIKDLK
ncbi:MAG: preprotein translocase subunit YajC [Endozoicomonadaceae bacterium]|nr:preprotein translocase subunit YajC [Endozoicomonadaceae bacterium]MCY4328667.1 preprotein translocase subunit YajC [Endozoicomonadaceae bacterium]